MGPEIFIFIMFWTMIFVGFLSFALYFLPIAIAFARRSKHILWISLITIFLGWTFLGWLAALLWSLNRDIQPEEKILIAQETQEKSQQA